MHIHNWYFSKLATISLLASRASADWRYKSRPDLSPPTLNITIPASAHVSPGYLFLAPFSGYPEVSSGPGSTRHGPLQAAPYIFTDTGDLVWSGFTFFSIWATNFQVVRWKGRDVLASFEGSHNAAYGHGQFVRFPFLSSPCFTVNRRPCIRISTAQSFQKIKTDLIF